MKSPLRSIAPVVFAALVSALATAPAVAAEQFINVLTGGTSGVYYPLGVALGSAIGKAMPDTKTSVQSTKASVENLNLLQAGRGEIAFTLGDSLCRRLEGQRGSGIQDAAEEAARRCRIYPNYIQIVASADSGIKTTRRPEGQAISVGAPKSGTELNARAILGAAGLSYSDFSKVEYLPFGESVELMKNRQLDVTLQSAGLGVASLRDLAASVDVVVVADPARRGQEDRQPGLYRGDHPGQHVQGPDRRTCRRRRCRTTWSPTRACRPTSSTG